MPKNLHFNFFYFEICPLKCVKIFVYKHNNNRISEEVALFLELKSDSHLPKKFLFIRFNESPLKMMKNAFYFILKALFVLKIFRFLS